MRIAIATSKYDYEPMIFRDSNRSRKVSFSIRISCGSDSEFANLHSILRNRVLEFPLRDRLRQRSRFAKKMRLSVVNTKEIDVIVIPLLFHHVSHLLKEFAHRAQNERGAHPTMVRLRKSGRELLKRSRAR
jgi:hypothetical protein